ncbi:DMT family transporter [Salininema proteolyticum]|uniref:DMT family transporter n=1 Tax=Salininema proteolyticum TaxID=1607685 RepID=A0ABV8TVL0_9ACTN
MDTLATATRQRKGTAELVAAMTLSGTLGVFVVESGASVYNVVFFRCLIGALALGFYSWARGYFGDTGFTPKKLGLAALGGAFIVFNWAFLFESYEGASISVATVVYHTQPFFVMLIGSLILRERPTAVKLGWLAVAFGGLVLVSGLTPSDLAGGGDPAYLKGIGYALLAAVFYAMATILTKKVVGVRPHLVALVQLTLGVFLLLPFTALEETASLGAGWGWLVGLGVIHTGLMYVLMYSAYQKLPTARIAVLAFTYPAVAMLVDWAVYGQTVTLVQAFGIPLIVAASLGVTLGWGVNKPAEEPERAPARA